MPFRKFFNPRFSVLPLALTALIVAACACMPAYAEIRTTDLIMGETVEDRGLTANDCPDIAAEYAIAVDSNGTVYYERGADTPAQIASMTKIMTAIVALENAPLDTVVTVDEEAATVGESSASLYQGETMDLETALYALMVPSGNDAAIAISKAVGAILDPDTKDPEQAFIDAMNATAEKIGCEDTVYENPHGLDSDGYEGDLHSTASDMAKIVTYAMKIDEFRTVVANGDTTITVMEEDGSERSIDLETTDELMGVYDGIIGVKTGYTGLAGYCFAGAVDTEFGEFYTVVMNSPDSDQRFVDTQSLMDWLQEHFVDYPLVNCPSSSSDEIDSATPICAYVAHQDWMDVTIPATFADPSATYTTFDLAGNISQDVEFDEIHGDVKAGDKLGTATFYQRNKVVATLDIVAAVDVEAPDFIEGIKIWWQRLQAGLSNQPTVAKSRYLNETPLIIDKNN